MQLKRIGPAFDRIYRMEQNSNLEKIEQANSTLESKMDALLSGKIDDAALQTDIEKKLNDLETQYAPQLTYVSSHLVDIDNKLDGKKNIKEFGAKGNANFYDTVTKKYYEDAKLTIVANDDTQAIEEAVSYSKTHGVSIGVPSGNYLFTKQINLDGKVSIVGHGSNYSARFLKHFEGHGFFITANRCELLNLSIFASEGFRGKNVGSAVVIGDDEATQNIRANWCKIDIFSMYHGEHGIDCRKGNECIIKGNYDQNRHDGVHCSSDWVGGAADWNACVMEFSAMGNGRHGLYLYRAETNYINATVQGNGWRLSDGIGAYINWSGNHGFIYAEGNVNGQITYGSSGYGNDISMHTVNQNPLYQNHKNVGYVNVTGSGMTGFYKMFRASLKNVVYFTIQTPSNTVIPANSHLTFETNTAYGISDSNSVFQSSPSRRLEQGLSYEVYFGSADRVVIALHNNTGSPITISNSIVWRCLGYSVLL